MSQSLSSRKAWASRIRRRFIDAVEAILDVGRYLIAAKRELPHGEFERMIVEDLGWHPSTARRLMLIARHPVLSKRAHMHALPPSWGTLYELAKLPTPTLERALRNGRITPTVRRSELSRLLGESRRRTPRASTCTVGDLVGLADRGFVFGTIYADPPWDYDDTATRGAAARHYATMTVEEIARLPVAELALPNSHLHLWTTNAFLFESKAIVEAWGFTYKSMLVWVKPQLGVGHYWRMAHEFLVLGVRGQCPFAARNFPSWFAAERRDHSRKPDTVRSMIEAVSPPPRLELFGRVPEPGWVVWGNEIDRGALTPESPKARGS